MEATYASELPAIVKSVEDVIKSRGYARVNSYLSVYNSDFYSFRLYLEAKLNEDDAYSDTIYESATGETIEELSKQIPVMLERFPPRAKAEQRKFNETAARLAEMAERLGQSIDEIAVAKAYADVAETLREHLRNNLIES